MKSKGSTQQIPYTGVPFVILRMKRLDCTHGVIDALQQRKKDSRKKLNCYEANLAGTLSSSPIFLLVKPIFYVLTLYIAHK